MNPDRLIGLAYAAGLWHSGQGSRGYRLLCKINWQPGTLQAAHLEPKEEWTEARKWAAHYFKLAKKLGGF